MHTANVAVTLSVLLHAGLAMALLIGRPSFQPPRVAMAEGRDAPAVTMRFLTAEQLASMTRPAAPLTPSETVEPIDTPPQPPTDAPARLATVEVTVDRVEPMEPTNPSDLPAPPPSQADLRSPPAATSTTPVTADAPPDTTATPQPASSTPTTASEAGVDAEPQPIDLPRPRYPLRSRRIGEQGEVVLSFTVTAEGEVADIEVERSPGHPRLVAAAKAALQAARFTPATRDGRPIPYRATLPFRFQLK